MYTDKLKGLLGKIIKYIVIIGGIFTFFDYLFFKFKLISLINSYLFLFYNYILANILFFTLSIIFIIYFFYTEWRLKKIDTKEGKNINSKKRISDIEKRIKSNEDKALSLEIEIKRLVIDRHIKRGELGAISALIDLLRLKQKQKWGEEEVLLEIKKYIEENGMYSYYFKDLKKLLDNVDPTYSTIRDSVLKVAEEGVYSD